MIEVIIKNIEGNTVYGEIVTAGEVKKCISYDKFLIYIRNDSTELAKWIDDRYCIDLPFKGRVKFSLQFRIFRKMIKCIECLNS